MEANAVVGARWKAHGRRVTLSIRGQTPRQRQSRLPRSRWLVAGLAAIVLHLLVLAALLAVPRKALEDHEAAPELTVTLIPEPVTAEAPSVNQPAETPPENPQEELEPVLPPPLAVPALPPETAPPPEAVVPPPAAPPPPEMSPPEPAVPPPEIPPPPPPLAVPALPPETAPPPEAVVPPPPVPQPPAPTTRPVRPRLTAPAPKAASPLSTAPSTPQAPVATPPSIDVKGPYQNSLAAHIRPYQRYPDQSRRRREEGLVILRVRVQRDGQVAAMSIEHGSGSEALDREALAALKRADPMPPVPAGLDGTTIEVEFPVRFHLE